MLGKLFGGAFGFIVGGPLGALIGAAAGHNLDQGAWNPTATGKAAGPADAGRVIFLATTFQLLGCIAKADGRVSEPEIAIARAAMDQLRLNSAQRQAAIDCFTEGKQAAFALDAALDRFQQSCGGQSALLQQLLELLLLIAYADGALHPQAHTRLLQISSRLGFARLQFEALHTLFRARHGAWRGSDSGTGKRDGDPRRPSTAVNTLSQAYQILGLQRDASVDQIKLAYRRLIRQHHPDKLAAQNLPAAELARATDKTREITAAYERIREERGF